MTRVRDNQGMMLGIVIVVLVLLMFGTAAVAALATASWRSTLRVDADTEAANVLASAINIVDGLAIGLDSSARSRTPEDACVALHNHAPSTPLSDCSAPPTRWTGWMTLPGNPDTCGTRVLEGCWRARFTITPITVDLEGQDAQTLTAWNVDLQAAARCDQLPDATKLAEDACQVVTESTTVGYQPHALPLYSSIVGTPELLQPMIDAAREGGVQFGPDAPVPDSIITLRGSYGGLFVNNAGGIGICSTVSQQCGESQGQAITLEDVNVAENACSNDPAVLSWVGGAHHKTAVLVRYPGSGLVVVSAPEDDPNTDEDERSILITGDITAPDSEPLLIVSGCHVIVGRCEVGQDTDNDGVADQIVTIPSCDRTDAPPSSGFLPETWELVNISIDNVIIVAAGGLWAADLNPSATACPTLDDTNTPNEDESDPGYPADAPALTISGSVIIGHAGATSRFANCDFDILNGAEEIVAGYFRYSSLPDPDQWAGASVAWWPGREIGAWRRR